MLEQYRQAFDALPGSLKTAAREAAMTRLLNLGLPTTDIEEWKYTDLATPLSTLAIPAPLAHAIVDVVPQSLQFSDGFDALNAAFAEDGLQLIVPAGSVLTEPVEAGLHRASVFGEAFTHRRNHIRLGANASATILLRSQPQDIELKDGVRLSTLFTELELEAGASATVIRVQDEPAQGIHVSRLNARLGRDARLNVVSVDLGGKLVRSDINISLDAPGAAAQLHGLYAPAGSTHVDNHTRIEHRAPHCTSRENYRGIAGDSAHAVFNGMIVVHEGAKKTDSEQRVANLLLSPRAQVNAKPELEIYNDDVKCAHGATFGQLDEDAVFYLRSRGLDHAAARSLLTYTFAYEVLAKISIEALRKDVQRKFLARLPNGAALSALLSLPPFTGEGQDGGAA